MMGTVDDILAAPAPTGPAPDMGTVDRILAQPARTFSAGETFGLNAVNLFGAAPALYGALKYVESGAQDGSYSSARDELQSTIDSANADDEHKWARRLGKLASVGAETVVGGGVGKAVSAGAKGLGVAAKLAPWAAENPIIAKVLGGAASGGAYGATAGAGEAASHGEDVGEGALAGAKGGAVFGGALGGLAGGAGKLLKGSGARESEDLLRGVTHGEGVSGSATVTARKLVDRDKEDIIRTLKGDAELRAAASRPAKEALPVFKQRLEDVGSQLDPHYDVIDRVTGGVSVHNLVNTLDDEIARLAKTPLNEQYIHAIEEIKQSALKAWAPDLEKVAHSQGKLAQMGIETPLRLQPKDVLVPTRDVRAMVTRLQTRGSQVINTLNPGESSQMKADMATMLKGFLDSHLDVAAEQSPQVATAVASIRDLNSTYSALKNMYKAVEQRGWKEATGSVSTGGHLRSLFQHGGMLAAVPSLMHGNIPAAVATVAAGALAPRVPQAARSANAALANLQRAAAAGNPRALHLLDTLANLRKVGTAGGGHIGGVVNSMGAQ